MSGSALHPGRHPGGVSRRRRGVGCSLAALLCASLAVVVPALPSPAAAASSATTTLVSKRSDATLGDADSFWHALSGDGRLVAFVSQATNLVPGDTNGVWDTFVHDRVSG